MQDFFEAEAEFSLPELSALLFWELAYDDKLNDMLDLVVDQNEPKQLILGLKLRLYFKISFNLNLI